MNLGFVKNSILGFEYKLPTASRIRIISDTKILLFIIIIKINYLT